jgi:competence protein ComEC
VTEGGLSIHLCSALSAVGQDNSSKTSQYNLRYRSRSCSALRQNVTDSPPILIISSAMRLTLVLLLAMALPVLSAARSKDLRIFFVDVEGGQSTLMVTPSGQSILIDAGWPDNSDRDALRIAAAAKSAKIKKIDYFILTHYHADHVGGVPQLVQKLPVGTFIDHGPNREEGNKRQQRLVDDYNNAIAGAKHVVVKPGEHLPISGIEGTVVSADGNVLSGPLPGAGEQNRYCASTPDKETDPSENARSLGTVWQLGGFRFVDMGDLTWNKEKELMCPVNRLGRVDLFVVSHHGLNWSNSPALVDAIGAKAAVMDNGAKKGGSPSTYDVLKNAPGLRDIWQLHFAEEGGKEHNAPDSFIANIDEADTGYYLKVTAHEDGSFEVYNPRNKFSKTYGAK